MLRLSICLLMIAALPLFAADPPPKLDFGPADSQPTTTPPATGEMIRLTIGERGQCELEYGPSTLTLTPASQPTTMPMLRGARVIQLSKNRWQATFQLASAVDSDLTINGVATVAGDALVLTPEQGHNQTAIGMRRRMRPPSSVALSFERLEGWARLKVWNGFEKKSLTLTYNSTKAHWDIVIERGTERTVLASNLKAPSGGKLKFLVPPAKMRLDDPLDMSVGATGAPLLGFEATGNFCSDWGLGLELTSGKVTINKVLGSAAIDAGFLPGDMIVTIDGKAPRDQMDAIRILGSVQIGDPVVFKVSRDGKAATVQVVAP